MARKITSTELKQNTRKVIADILKNPDEEVVVYTYNEPKVAIVSQSYLDELKGLYSDRARVNRSATLQELKMREDKDTSKKDKILGMIKKGGKIDSAKLIRKMRDAE